MRVLARIGGDGTLEAAEKLIDEILDEEDRKFDFDYVDLGAGSRPLKVDLSGFEFDADLYDRDHGDGLAQKVIENLRRAIIEEGQKKGPSSFAYLLSKISIHALEQKTSEEMEEEKMGGYSGPSH